jgi:hypothetical protein
MAEMEAAGKRGRGRRKEGDGLGRGRVDGARIE